MPNTTTLRPTFSQFANAFVPFGLLLCVAMLLPEAEQNLLKGRVAYSVWASLILVTPALCLYSLPNPTLQRRIYANLFYTLAYLAYLVHFYYTVFGMFGGFEGMWQSFPHPIAISNLLLTVWWPVDIVLAWKNPPAARWLTIEHFLARAFVFLSFFLSSVIFLAGRVTVLGIAMTVAVAICLLIRWRDHLTSAGGQPGAADPNTKGADMSTTGDATGTLAEKPLPPGLEFQFTETMRGYFSTREKDDYEKAEQLGRTDNKPFSFTLTIRTDDLEHFITDKFHKASITGTVTAPELSAQPLTVTGGEFNLFVDDAEEVNTKKMRYSMRFTSGEGKPYYMFGFKTIRNDPGLDIWPDTTTLRIKVYAGDDSSGTQLGAGILHIAPADFMHQLTTMRVFNAQNKLEELRGMVRFGKLFAGALYQTYGGIFSKPNVFNPSAPPRSKRKLDVPAPPEVYEVPADDGVKLRLTRYRGGSKGPVMCVPGLGVSSLIFSTDLIERNLVEELVAHQYDVWLLDYRSSIELPYATQRFTADDIATRDYPAAVAFIRKTTGAPSIQCLVHCYGATTFFMAMLAGLQGVRSAAVSQIATHVKVPLTTEIKALFHAADFMDKLGIESMTAYVDTHTSFLGKVADQMLKLYPVHSGPRDVSPVSRRISFLYGQLYEVNQLNEQTYDNLHELFGVASIASLEHLAMIIRKGHAVNAKGEDVYLQEKQGMPNLKRLAIPIAIAHGALNKCWEPVSTEITIELLKKANDPKLYDRKLIPNYGHIDCIFGKNAARDVFPYWIQHLDKTAQL